MIPVPVGSAERDILRWLADVYVVRSEKNGTIRAFTSAVLAPSADGGTLVYGYPLEPTYRERRDRVCATLENCFAHWPPLGYFNDRDGRVVHISRRTIKQYHRSLCADGIRASVLSGDCRPSYASPSSVVYVPYVYLPYYSPESAMEQVMSGRLQAAAITRHVAVCRTLCKSKTSLYVQGHRVGTVSGNKVVFDYEKSVDARIREAFGGTYEYVTCG